MEEQKIVVSLAGIPVAISIHDPQTRLYFSHYPETGEPAIVTVSVPDDRLVEAGRLYPAEMEAGAVEFNELALYTSDVLLAHNCCIFHGVAFIWREKAYIFTAPSGTGKTTQYILWKMQFGEEIRIINGDKPILKIEDDSRITVHHSPWRGKEGMGRLESAELGGIIILEQGKNNEICLLEKKYSALPVFRQFMYSASHATDVHRVARMTEQIVNQVPIWRLINRGDADSVKLCSEAILRYGDDVNG